MLEKPVAVVTAGPSLAGSFYQELLMSSPFLLLSTEADISSCETLTS